MDVMVVPVVVVEVVDTPIAPYSMILDGLLRWTLELLARFFDLVCNYEVFLLSLALVPILGLALFILDVFSLRRRSDMLLLTCRGLLVSWVVNSEFLCKFVAVV